MKDPGADDCVLYDLVKQLQKLSSLVWRSGPKKKKKIIIVINYFKAYIFYTK